MPVPSCGGALTDWCFHPFLEYFVVSDHRIG